MQKTGIIEIKLHSDLCSGSGYSYAGIIDNDICYDAFGIPYLPAKRLKGCMRDSAERLLYSILPEQRIQELFGIRGNDRLQGVTIGNGYIREYDRICRELESAMANQVLTPQEVLAQFTHIQAQTAMEHGVTKGETLRYTRVMDATSPFDGEPLSLYAEISFEEDAEGTVEADLCRILSATRSIGLKRNRGMGSVSCRLSNVEKKADFSGLSAGAGNGETQSWKRIFYVVKNEAPLMISSNTDDHSEKYIPGQAVLGALAGRYPKEKRSSDDGDFRNLFLGGAACYTNLYPCVDGKIFYPAPEYLNRLKKTGCYVNTLFSYETLEKRQKQELGENYSPAEGNLPKKLKGKFVTGIQQDALQVQDVDMQVTYHHRQKGASPDQQEQLYPMVTVQQGQYFAGFVYVREDYVQTMLRLLGKEKEPLFFGKSRTAQYGRCTLVQEPVVEDVVSKKETYEKNQWILVELQSDTILLNEAGEYTVYREEVLERVAAELGISWDAENTALPSRITPCLLNGYAGTWNLRKATVPAISAGSCLLYYLTEEVTVNRPFLGERNMEGYGQFVIRRLEDLRYPVAMAKENGQTAPVQAEYTRKLIIDSIVERALQEAKLEAIRDRGLKVSNSALGRITLMLKESLRIADPEAAYADFGERIESIKTKKIREDAENRILKKFGRCTEKKQDLKDTAGSLQWKFEQLPQTEKVKEILQSGEILGISPEELTTELNQHWGDYLMELLVSLKYESRGRGERKEEKRGYAEDY
ncbi:MAG: hypothetical protein Q4B85_02020 [Lachnospiraceae bacterium]|nr:hypothetical protein [Lachnospiraceae bacterium]